MREWSLFVCNACGDFSLGGWEEVVHTPNLRCPGRSGPNLVELVVVVPKRDALMPATRGQSLTA